MGIDSYIADASELRSIIKETPNPKAITTTVMPNGDVEIDAHRYQHGLNGKNAAARDLASPDVFLKYMAEERASNHLKDVPQALRDAEAKVTGMAAKAAMNVGGTALKAVEQLATKALGGNVHLPGAGRRQPTNPLTSPDPHLEPSMPSTSMVADAPGDPTQCPKFWFKTAIRAVLLLSEE